MFGDRERNRHLHISDVELSDSDESSGISMQEYSADLEPNISEFMLAKYMHFDQSNSSIEAHLLVMLQLTGAWRAIALVVYALGLLTYLSSRISS